MFIYTVQVKSTEYIRDGNYKVQLRTAGGTSGKVISKFNEDKFIDFLFIVTSNGKQYNISCKDIVAKSELTINNRFVSLLER